MWTSVRICLELVNTYWIPIKKLSVNLEHIRCILVCLCIILDFLDSAYLSDIIQLLNDTKKEVGSAVWLLVNLS